MLELFGGERMLHASFVVLFASFLAFFEFFIVFEAYISDFLPVLWRFLAFFEYFSGVRESQSWGRSPGQSFSLSGFPLPKCIMSN